MKDLIARIEEAAVDLRAPAWDARRSRRALAGFHRRRRRRRVSMIAGGAAGTALLAAFALTAPRRDPARPLVAAVERETSVLALRDGSRAAALGPTSELQLREEDAARATAVLTRGAARFEVAANPARTFRVEAGTVTVHTGDAATFSVALLDERTAVSVTAGAVVVEWPGGRRALAARQGGIFPADARARATEEARNALVADESARAQPAVPAARMREAASFGLRTRNGDEERARASLFAAAGFRRAIVEVQWQDVDPDDPTVLGGRRAEKRGTIALLRERGVRPVILLDAYATLPRRGVELRLAAPASRGARSVRLDAASAARVIPGRTLLEHDRAFIASVDGDGVARLTRGLRDDVTAGPRAAANVVFPPFPRPVLADGAPNPAFEEPLNGWLAFVGATVREARDVAGDDFDLLVWGRPSSPVLDIDAYHEPPVTPPGVPVEATAREILARTVAFVRQQQGLDGVRVVDGFGSRRAGPRAPAPGVHGYARQLAAIRVAGAQRAPLFPEIFLTSLAPDAVGAELASRAPGAPELAITAFAVWADRAEDRRRAITRSALRALSAYVGSGATLLSFYEPGESTQLAVEGDPSGGETVRALGRFLAAFDGPDDPGPPRALRVAADDDGVAAFPFQRAPGAFVVPVYLMTRDVTEAASPRAVALELIGVREGAELSAIDPVSGADVPVEVVRRAADRVVVRLDAVDHPRLLRVDEP